MVVISHQFPLNFVVTQGDVLHLLLLFLLVNLFGITGKGESKSLHSSLKILEGITVSNRIMPNWGLIMFLLIIFLLLYLISKGLFD